MPLDSLQILFENGNIQMIKRKEFIQLVDEDPGAWL